MDQNLNDQNCTIKLSNIADVGNLIRIHRERLGMTQLELAEKALVGEKTISRLETGKSIMRIDTFFALVAALGVTPNDISPVYYTSINNDYRLSSLESNYNLLGRDKQQLLYDVVLLLIKGLLKTR